MWICRFISLLLCIIIISFCCFSSGPSTGYLTLEAIFEYFEYFVDYNNHHWCPLYFRFRLLFWPLLLLLFSSFSTHFIVTIEMALLLSLFVTVVIITSEYDYITMFISSRITFYFHRFVVSFILFGEGFIIIICNFIIYPLLNSERYSIIIFVWNILNGIAFCGNLISHSYFISTSLFVRYDVLCGSFFWYFLFMLAHFRFFFLCCLHSVLHFHFGFSIEKRFHLLLGNIKMIVWKRK